MAEGKVASLGPLLGRWSVQAGMGDAEPSDIGAWTAFEWMPGETFMLQRWEVPVPEAPDGLAVLGWDEGRGSLLQHYFDSRGVARLYEMSLGDGVWKLTRSEADFSPLDFSQRYLGTFSDDGKRIDGTWEICHDGKTWEKDFDLNYVKAD